ncbi:phytanoyl-CoA dioxygenase family protein [Paenibacillus nasutitermitis]|uniref:Phytanoyl-CoA dioxygenase n=1 Tax=Paenibacillus nasutitermitis TaxID=1652958 RepID=A0A916YM50_9BACL|nr:phytanoyl-CoA dioxygenase family protein [Paenibacillus nasutitermitis]GGD51087.1 phytanoyl-CoA dioxygenase [Paenibacillus nasutitermitis]
MKIAMGPHQLEMDGPFLTALRESNDICGDAEALQARMEEDGYLFIRGFHDRDKVLQARSEILEQLHASGKLAIGSRPEQGLIGPDNKGAFWGGVNTDKPAFLEVVNSPKVMEFFSTFLGGEVSTYDYKWLRAVANGESTGAHYDIVYMGRGTPNLYTLWTPIGDTPVEMGTLAILLGSHQWEHVRRTYGQMDVDRDHTEGWFSNDPLEVIEKYGGRWATSDFQAGDAILFGMFTMHSSTVNVTDHIRISCDTRYQLTSEPIDQRWVGRKPKAHENITNKPLKKITEAKKEWGLA